MQDASFVNGDFTNDGVLNIFGNPDVVSGHGTLTVANGMTNAGTINLSQSRISQCNTVNTFLSVATGTLVNTGAINSLAGDFSNGTRQVSAQLDNQGSVNTTSYPLTIDKLSAAHVNGGVINVSGGNLTITQSGTTPSLSSNGTISVAATRTMTVTGGTFANAAAGILTDGGTKNVSGTIFANNGTTQPRCHRYSRPIVDHRQQSPVVFEHCQHRHRRLDRGNAV